MTPPDSPSPRTEAGTCWFCRREVPWATLIAGYDTWDEQRLACPSCDRSVRWLRGHGWNLSRAANEADAQSTFDRATELVRAAQEAPAPEGLRDAVADIASRIEGFENRGYVSLDIGVVASWRGTLRAALSTPPSPAEPPRPDLWPGQAAPDAPSFWMIERGQSERHIPTVWWTGRSGREWTTDASEALRYESRTVAESVIAERSGVLPHQRFGRATEHAWLRAEARPPEGLDADRLAAAIDAAWRRPGSDHHVFGPGLADGGRVLARLIAKEWPDA